jgi:methanogenic corrinoid protein MtbC1
MAKSVQRQSGKRGGRLSIGALSRATGIPVETLRTWERRYGFPVPERKPSGHRIYPLSSVARLRRIAEALARGHRASEAVTAADADLTALLEVTQLSLGGAPAGDAPAEAKELSDISPLLRTVATFDAGQLTRILFAEWGRLGPLEFLRARMAPLVRAVGDAWAAARLEIRHEHFLSERASDLLRSLRLPLEEHARGPLVVCASLPGEAHGLGLQMAALVLVAVGCRLLYLGTEVPPAQVAGLARELTARAVAVSVSMANRGEAMEAQIGLLRGLLPRRITVLVGGDGAPGPRPGIKVIQDLGVLDTWGRRLVAAA